MKFRAKICAALLICCGATASAKSGRPILIWNGVASMEKKRVELYYHAPEAEGQRAAVIICPGGSYHHLGLYNEGYKTADWFAKKGVSAFMLRYRTAEGGHHHPEMLQDIQRAIQIVREDADSYGIDADKVGVIGYSAGGHLVTMAGAFHSSHDELSALGIVHEASLRPDFVVPVYPVVSMQDELAHRWSRKSLLGKDQSDERKAEFSMELQIPADMPPSYIVVAKDDNVVDYRNSLALYDAMQKQGVSCRIAIYDWGRHGFGMLDNKFMKEFRWNDALWQWLVEIGIVSG
ncbi:MAG: alpha/beta hydrolase [Treponemataceae bacterium]|nr:alpha/beta hydrolase [Treponemataceae bacterium]